MAELVRSPSGSYLSPVRLRGTLHQIAFVIQAVSSDRFKKPLTTELLARVFFPKTHSAQYVLVYVRLYLLLRVCSTAHITNKQTNEQADEGQTYKKQTQCIYNQWRQRLGNFGEGLTQRGRYPGDGSHPVGSRDEDTIGCLVKEPPQAETYFGNGCKTGTSAVNSY